ncbi:MAG: hypothetical protein AB8A40_08825 [Prochlorococcus sp.]|nr:hypothetical protein [Prochlorococcaceae cyanobacterium Fu_MAG_72]
MTGGVIKEVVTASCSQLDQLQPKGAPHTILITQMSDRLGHGCRYAIVPKRITSELGWRPRHDFEEALRETVL